MSQAVIAQPVHHIDTRYVLTALAQLALEIDQAEGLDLDSALVRAVEELESLAYYADAWDGSAANAGNWDAHAGTIPF